MDDKKDQQKRDDARPREGSSFIYNEQQSTAKTKSNLLQAPSITLPKGGGAVKSIDEKFRINAVNGTNNLSIPLPFSAGRNGSAPSYTLTYNSGTGKGVFGIGWSLDIPAIQRRTDKKLPEYRDSEDSDIFVLSGAEDLIPQLAKDASGNWKKVSANGVSRYRPRIESAFTRIEMINENGNIYWRTLTKENVVTVFGKSDDAKIIDPAPSRQNRIFKWCIEYSYDDKGNFTQYYYKKENLDNVAPALPERNRINNLLPFANTYLKGIKYGNTTPYTDGDDMPADFLFEMVFDFGEHDKTSPTTAEVNKWDQRADVFSNFRSGFDIRTYRICRRALMFHHFSNELAVADYLTASLDLGYDEGANISFLKTVTRTGYIRQPDSSLKSLSTPPLEFTYTPADISREVKEITAENIVNAPVGLDGPYQWIDLYSEGISGLLSEQAGGWYYKENEGSGNFSPAKLVSPRPSFAGLGDNTVVIQELDADGRKFLVALGGPIKGYFGFNEEDHWEGFRPFASFPNVDIKDPDLKLIDLDGDGKPDLLISEMQDFIWYNSCGTRGYGDYHLTIKADDEEKGPQIVFSDPDERMLIATADMTGDGLSDIVLITYAGVCYYPNLGFGNFGARVSMGMTGMFDSPESFSVQRIALTDIDGSGTTDIVYTGNKDFQVWFNQSGNSLSAPSEFFNPFPDMIGQAKLSFIDLLGNGTSCIVWSSNLPQDGPAPMKYIDMMNGIKPHILSSYTNNLGKEVSYEYRSSTSFYLEDKKIGQKWVTRLPFVVQCLSKVAVTDKVAQTRFATEYSYHHGYYDAVEREYRGFALVEQRDCEEYDNFVLQTQSSGSVNSVEKDVYQPAVITKTWFHTGAWLHRSSLFHQLQQTYYQNSFYLLPEGDAPPGLSGEEYREFCRSLKGLTLRQEIYSDEGTADLQAIPYSIVQHNYDVQLLQPKAGQPYSAFLPHERETLTFHLERNPQDPRIEHSLNTAIDVYGNVLESAVIAYGRKNPDAALPTTADKAKQTTQLATYLQDGYTAEIDTANAYRLPVLCDAQTWELNAGNPANTFFTAQEIKGIFAAAAVKLYEQSVQPNEKRKIEHSRTLFQKNDLSGPMPFATLDTLALPYESYLLAFTTTLLQTIYGGKYDEGLMRNAALYVRSEGDSNYWIRSGRTYFYPDLTANPNVTTIPAPTDADRTFAKSNFYLPVAYEDNFGNLTKVFYDQYKLLITRRVDAVQNEWNADAINYRIPSAFILRNENNNRMAVRFDELGRVIRTFIMGKDGESLGDPIDTTSVELSPNDQPTTIVEYQFRYATQGLPDYVKTSARETHYFVEPQPSASSGGLMGWLSNLFGRNSGNSSSQTNANPVWQDVYVYSDGSGHELLRKSQAEPGLAPQRDAGGKLVLDSTGNIVLKDTTPGLRWVGMGKTIYNNKGNPVKQYEPYFDSSLEFNDEKELVMLGCTDTLYYDAIGRVIRTDKPNGTYNRTEFDAWTQLTYDESDTVLDSEWYKARIGGALGPAEQLAAQRSALCDNTPTTVYLDTLARVFLRVEHNKTQRSNESVLEEFYYTRTEQDIEGNARSVTDNRGNPVFSWQYDMLGNFCYQNSMDAGERWLLVDVEGKPLRVWDSRKQVFSYVYDNLHRPLQFLVNTGSGDIVYEQFQYGEGAPNDLQDNLRAKIYKHYDMAGLVTADGYDFKGNQIAGTRQLLTDYATIPNWNVNPALDSETFVNETSFDALNRPVQLVMPDESILTPRYNESNLLSGMGVQLQGSSTVTGFVTGIDYNAKRQREQIYYGNNTTTKYSYDLQTYRLARLLTTANNGNSILQDLSYTYDPGGNIVQQLDNAQKTVFYGGQQVGATNSYIYDALYRLVEAGGREHAGQVTFNGQDNWNDNWCRLTLQPNSPMQLRNYTQKYFYDGVGNITRMQHIAGSAASWTRSYQYNAGNNQLTKTSVSGQNYAFSYNEHGSVIAMPQLLQVDWNMREEMQHAGLGGGGDAYFVYDSAGQRVRKVVDRGGGKLQERIYIGAYEVYRERTGTTVTLERKTLHLMDDKRRIAMVDTRTKGNDGTPAQFIRYQYNDHLQSACLELDDTAKVISYEEYHPFGSTAYQATDASRQVPAKRYRYIGMERDDETGLNYNSRRYYVPWLGRWLSADPGGAIDGMNLYRYSRDNPVTLSDPSGNYSSGQDEPEPQDLAYAAAAYQVGLALARAGLVNAAATSGVVVTVAEVEGVGAVGVAGGAGAAGGIITGAAIVAAVAFIGAVAIATLNYMYRSANIVRYGNPWGLTQDDFFPVIREVRKIKTDPYPDPGEEVKPDPKDKDKDKEKPRKEGRIYVTYTKYNSKTKLYYSGRTSAVIDLNKPWKPQAEAAMRIRDRNHHIDENDEPDDPAFDAAVLDKYAAGFAVNYDQRYRDFAYLAIRGREQQLIDYNGKQEADKQKRTDFKGGAQSNTDNPNVTENPIRGVKKDSKLGLVFHSASNIKFGEIAKFTGDVPTNVNVKTP